MKQWCELACNCLRKALQINASAIAVNANRDAGALVWCNKKPASGTKNIFPIMEKNSIFGKILRRPSDIFLQQLPVKSRAWIFFSTGCNVFVPSNVRNGVLPTQGFAEIRQCFVLRCIEALTFQAF
jgi:hypothetical protein